MKIQTNGSDVYIVKDAGSTATFSVIEPGVLHVGVGEGQQVLDKHTPMYVDIVLHIPPRGPIRVAREHIAWRYGDQSEKVESSGTGATLGVVLTMAAHLIEAHRYEIGCVDEIIEADLSAAEKLEKTAERISEFDARIKKLDRTQEGLAQRRASWVAIRDALQTSYERQVAKSAQASVNIAELLGTNKDVKEDANV